MPDAFRHFVLGRPGDEPAVLKVAATYEAATKHRAPPPAFGPLKGR